MTDAERQVRLAGIRERWQPNRVGMQSVFQAREDVAFLLEHVEVAASAAVAAFRMKCIEASKQEPPRKCGHDALNGGLQYETCVECALELGRREGVVAAGAWYTSEEAFAKIRTAAPANTVDDLPPAFPQGRVAL